MNKEYYLNGYEILGKASIDLIQAANYLDSCKYDRAQKNLLDAVKGITVIANHIKSVKKKNAKKRLQKKK